MLLTSSKIPLRQPLTAAWLNHESRTLQPERPTTAPPHQALDKVMQSNCTAATRRITQTSSMPRTMAISHSEAQHLVFAMFYRDRELHSTLEPSARQQQRIGDGAEGSHRSWRVLRKFR